MANYKFYQGSNGNTFYVGQMNRAGDGLVGWGYCGKSNGDVIISDFDSQGYESGYSIHIKHADGIIYFNNCYKNKAANGLFVTYTDECYKFYDLEDKYINGPTFEIYKNGCWTYHLLMNDNSHMVIGFSKDGLKAGVIKNGKWLSKGYNEVDYDDLPFDLTLAFEEFSYILTSRSHFTTRQDLYQRKYGTIYPPNSWAGVYIDHPSLSEIAIGQYSGRRVGISLHAYSDEWVAMAQQKNNKLAGPAIRVWPQKKTFSYCIQSSKFDDFCSSKYPPEVYGNWTEYGIGIRILFFNYGNRDEYDVLEMQPDFRVRLIKRFNNNTDDCQSEQVLFGFDEEE